MRFRNKADSKESGEPTVLGLLAILAVMVLMHLIGFFGPILFSDFARAQISLLAKPRRALSPGLF